MRICRLCILLWGLSFNPSLAQEKTPVNFGNLTPKDFSLPANPVISNAGAVIIADKGSTVFKGNGKGVESKLRKEDVFSNRQNR